MAFKKPEKVINGTRILIYGEAGTRKTRSALSFPKNLYINADQGGDDYYDEFIDNIIQVSDSTTFSEVMEDLDEVENMLDEVETITLDSWTKIYENQQHVALRVAEQRAMKNNRLKEGEGLSPKEWGVIKLNAEKMASKLLGFKKDGKTVIVIAEGKDEKEASTDSQGNTVFKKVGIMPNTQKDFDFDFDIVIEMVRDPKTKLTLGGRILKDRLGVVAEGTLVENPNYDIWADAIQKKRQGIKKAQKIDLEATLVHDEESFNATGGANAQGIIDEIMTILNPLNQEKKSMFQAELKEKFGSPKFREETDPVRLKNILKLLNEIKAK